MKKVILLILMVTISLTFAGCSSANRAAYNLGRQAEEFQIARRIAAINGITDKPVFEVIGFCSVESDEADLDGFLEMTCKNGEESFSKHFLYLGDNVNIYIEQLVGIDVPQYHYQIIFAPQALLPVPVIVSGPIGE